VVAALTGLYLLWTGLVIGWRIDHFVVLAACLAGYYAHRQSRRFTVAFFIFVVYALIYDSMRVYPNYRLNEVHVQQPYTLEKAWFGIESGGQRLTPNEFCRSHTTTFLDVLSGLFYINWLSVPFLFAVYLYAKDALAFLRFSYAFVLTNLIGFVIYYLYPAAPPWYVEQHGFALDLHTPGNVAGLSGFDAFWGIPAFAGIYGRNSNIFAAIPSLHAAYPLVVLFYGLRLQLGWVNRLFGAFVLGIWLSAVYTRHHYIIDVLAGALCALVACVLVERALRNTRLAGWLRRLANQLT